ncbi:MAG: aminodeoxychorismate synthase component I [Bacteroidota bacterium]
MTKNEAISLLNKLGAKKIPFSFYCDFLGENWVVLQDSTSPKNVAFQLKVGEKNSESTIQKPSFKKSPIDFTNFKGAFDKVIKEINIGNSFLTNLTFETPIETNLTIEEIFSHSTAKYKLLVPQQFVVFSPETFIKIQDGVISSNPMKGTIDADISNASEIILNDQKETAEHVTIVDLIRNDLSQVANNVRVSKFRYIDKLVTNDKNLLQVSSEIQGDLSKDWQSQLGSILSKLIPAGSISGAPKPETIRIIGEVESYDREFYTGICGHFNGDSLDTGVMIRFIKKVNDQLIFCSGGGITSFSEVKKEYQEMMDKVYLAF